MSANTLFHYFGDIREWNVLAKAELPKVLAAHPGFTQDQALDFLEKTKPGLNLWMTPEATVAKGMPKGLELWKIHVLGWLFIPLAGTVIGLKRWADKRDALLAAAAAKAKAKTAGA